MSRTKTIKNASQKANKKTKRVLTNSEPKTILISSSDGFYDDCPVCGLMKKAEKEGRSPTETELREVFVKANTQN